MTQTRRFRPLILTALVIFASLSCYLISLRVASERAALESVEQDIALVTRDIRELETEIGTRGRLAQLERWNVNFLRLSAPRANQFVESGFHLATLAKPEGMDVIDAPIVLASVEVEEDVSPLEIAAAPSALPGPKGGRPADLMQLASIEREPVAVPRAAPPKLSRPKPKGDPLAAARDPLAPIPSPASASVDGVGSD